MRIILCAKNDLPACMAVNRLVTQLVGHEMELWLSDVERNQENAVRSLRMLRFFERELPNRIVFPLLEENRDRPASAMATFSELAARHSIRTRHITSLNSSATIDYLTRFAPDLIVSIRFSHIFAEPILSLPRFGILNLHPGGLPRYAGLFAPMRQLLDGQSYIRTTLHWIDKGIDTGAVIERAALPVQRDRSLIWHVANAYLVAIDRLVETVEAIGQGQCPSGTPQDLAKRNYHKLPRQEEFDALERAGWSIVEFRDVLELLQEFGAVQSELPGQVAREYAFQPSRA